MNEPAILTAPAMLHAPATTVAEPLLRGLTVTAAVGSGVAAGVFFAFSTFVMKALESLPPRDGLRAMQAINVAAPNALFMGVLFGTALVCAGLVVVTLRGPAGPAATLRLAAAAIYLVTVVGLTAVYHVPHNDALALVSPDSAGAARTWTDYAGSWTLWNHLRTIGGIASAGALTWATRLG